MLPIKDGMFITFTSLVTEREVTGRVTCVEMYGTVVDLDVDGMSYTFRSVYATKKRIWRLIGELGDWMRTA